MGKPAFSPIRDLISGAILAATSVPQLIAYAELVGYAGSRGLATAGAPLLAWGLSTGSPFMNCGVTSITALMAKVDLGGEAYVAEYGEEEYVKLVAAYSLYVGLASVVLGLVGFGKLAQRVPKPVLKGFKWGCAVGVLVSATPNGIFASGSKQLKSLVAQSDLAGSIVSTLKEKAPAATGAVNVTNFFFGLTHPHLWSLVPVMLFVLGTAFVMNGKKFLPKFLPSGTEVIIATAAATLYSMHFDYEGGIVGEIPEIDPDAGISLFGGALKIPIEIIDVKGLIMDVPVVDRFGSWAMLAVTATLFAGVNFLSIMGTLTVFETENNIAYSAPRELIAQGISCGIAGAVGSAPVSGSMSRSLVARMTGATSQMACMVTALFWIYLLPYMSVMSPTPKAALSAVIVSAVLKSVVLPKDLNKMEGLDFVVGWGTGIITALTSPTIGFGVGLILYMATSVLRTPEKKKIA